MWTREVNVRKEVVFSCINTEEETVLVFSVGGRMATEAGGEFFEVADEPSHNLFASRGSTDVGTERA